ncbi:MAG TPA: hypothetical protein VGK73_01975, partial [Polyangiaceae bacterium]
LSCQQNLGGRRGGEGFFTAKAAKAAKGIGGWFRKIGSHGFRAFSPPTKKLCLGGRGGLGAKKKSLRSPQRSSF